MNEPLIVTQAVTFCPVRYPLKWVETPEGVPIWDVSRGVKPLGYWQADEPQATMPAFLLVDTAADEAVAWGGRDAPSDKQAYPRLVCAKPHLLSSIALPAIRPSQAVAGLARFIGKPSFEGKVLQLASDYALIHPTKGDSLDEWIRFVKRTSFDMLLVQVINEARAEHKKALEEKRKPEPFSIEDTFEFVNLLLPEAARDEADQQRHFIYLFNRSELLHDLPVKVAEHVKGTSFFRDAVPKRADAAAAMLFAHHWQFFEGEAEIKLSNGRFNALCGLETWVHYELALALQNASDLGICKGCHQPYFKQHGKQTVCDPKKSACRMKAKRREPEDSAQPQAQPRA